MNNSLISVIIPVYKAEPYLRRCLESILLQSHRELEILLVDDGSPDKCGAICDEYAARDGRIKVFHTENRGAYAARNTALDAARGTYLAFADADDWLESNLFEVLLELLLTYGADISQCEIKNEGTYTQIRSKQFGGPVVYEREQLAEAFFHEGITHGLLGKLFRADIWDSRRFAEEYYHVDAMTLAGIGDYCARFVRVDDALYHYNTTNPSITRGKRDLRHVESKEKLFQVYSEFAQRAGAAGSFFLCREIPSAGRLILPSRNIPLQTVVRHIQTMHGIFVSHWKMAKKAEGYVASPKSKKVLWHLFRRFPLAASALTALYAQIR